MNQETTPSQATELSAPAEVAKSNATSGAGQAAALKRKIISAPRRARSVRPPAKKKSEKAAAEAEHFDELLSRLQRLRQTTRDTALAYLTKIDLDLSAIVKRLTRESQTGKRRALKGGTLKQMLKLAKKIDLKPAKGRRKDLRKIEKAVGQIKRRMGRK